MRRVTISYPAHGCRTCDRRRHGRPSRPPVLIMSAVDSRPLRILHATRAPVGGIFRHILDLANGQADRGHHVGIIADSLTGGERAEQALAEIAPRLKLGVHRLAIRREPHPADFQVWASFQRFIRQLEPDVLHGHGAKAGAFMRLKTASRTKSGSTRRTAVRCTIR